jgi:hypothetical protein
MAKIIQITKEKAEQSKVQKDFNRLIKKIEKLEQEIAEYRAGLDEVNQRLQGTLTPARKEYYVQKAELVKCFDRAYDSGYFKKREEKKLTYLICELAYDVIEYGGMEELIPIYDKYNETSYEEENEQANELAAEQLKGIFSMFGIEFDDDVDTKNPEVFQEQMAKKLAEKQEKYDSEQRQAEERKDKRPKSKKQQEKEEKKELEARNVTKSVRTIYMDLVKAFHPDREPNEEERERKTQIMQRVTEAYEKNDLLGLLRLQLEFDRIDQNHIENIAESHLKNYNKLLREQAEELSYELENMVSQVAEMSGKPDYIVSNIHRLRLSLEQDIKEFKSAAKSIKNDVKVFGSQLFLKEFLKSYKIPKAEKDIDFFEGVF